MRIGTNSDCCGGWFEQVFSYAVHDIKNCRKLVKVLEIVLAIGNYLNGSGPKGGAYGFKLEVLKIRQI